MNSPQPSSRINGGGRGPHPSWGEHLAVIVPSLILVEEQSRIPGGSLGLLYWGMVAPVTTLVYLARCRRAVRNAACSLRPTLGSWSHWLILPVCLGLVAAGSLNHWPARLRFGLSQRSFERLVAAPPGDQLRGPYPRWIGLYWVRSEVGGALFENPHPNRGFITGSGPADPCGLEYDPADPQATGGLTLRLAPGWYLTEW